MNSLAQILTTQGELLPTRQLHENVLEILTRVLGPEHPSTLTSMWNLLTSCSTARRVPQIQSKLAASWRPGGSVRER